MNEDVWSEEFFEDINNEWDYMQNEYNSIFDDEE